VVSRDEKGEISGLDYGKLSTVLIASVQAQEKEIDHLRLSLLISWAVILALAAGGILWIGTRHRP
jgi:hypothetical protein